MDKYATPNSLKEHAVKRVILDMINDIKSTSGSQETLIVMIVDDYTVKILSSIVSMSDLLAKGVFSLEKLEIAREAFPKFHGLYFISPTEASIKILEQDFADPKYPQYGRVHIFFSHSCTDGVLNQLSKNDNLVRRLKTCKEVNFSFLVKDNNLFDLGMSTALEIYTTKNDEINRNIILSNLSERLFTVCTVLNEFPYIQYNKNSMYCSKLAEFLHSKLAPFYKNKSFNEKRGILLICDRTFDITSPFLHDYFYECMIYDMFNIKDNLIELPDKKNYKFDEKDRLWIKLKNKHIAEAFQELQKDFNAFMQSDISKMQRGQGNDMQDFDQMSKVLHGIKGYQTQSTQFKVHLDLADEVTRVI
jgi:syntaxin-binding protein 1